MSGGAYSTWSRERKKFSNWKKRHRHDKVIVYLSQIGMCWYCDKFVPFKKMTWEHLLPLSYGGENKLKNLRLSCPDCNCKKNIETQIIFYSPFYVLKEKIDETKS